MITVSGVVLTKPVVAKAYGLEEIYKCMVQIKGTKTKACDICVMFKKSSKFDIQEGSYVILTGSLRTTYKDNSQKELTYLFATACKPVYDTDFEFINDVTETNVKLVGKIDLRKSNSDSNVQIAGFKVKVQSSDSRMYIVKCYVKGDLAVLVQDLKDGDLLNIQGRLVGHRTKRGILITSVNVYSIELVSCV